MIIFQEISDKFSANFHKFNETLNIYDKFVQRFAHFLRETEEIFLKLMKLPESFVITWSGVFLVLS